MTSASHWKRYSERNRRQAGTLAQGGQAAGLTRLTETIAEGACATVTLGWTNYAGYRVTLHEQSAARSERVFLVSVAIVRYIFSQLGSLR